MDFAKKILNKYGWKEGEGLGKNNDGIAKPLKASLKFDNTGLGSDQAASDFNNHWWNRIYNEATQNIEIKNGGNGKVSMELKEADAVEISTKGYSTKKLKKAKQNSGNDSGGAQYNNFLQSATLSSGGCEIENPNKINSDDISVTQYKILTDEELFKACGGRTAHKGARHGLKLSGKLARLEQQEQMLLEKMKTSESHKMENNVLNDDIVNSAAKKSKKKKRKSEIIDEDITKSVTNESSENYEETSEYVKRKRRKQRAEIFDDFEDSNLNVEHNQFIEINSNSFEDITGNSIGKKMKKKKRKENSQSTESNKNEDISLERKEGDFREKTQKSEGGDLSDKIVADTKPETINGTLQSHKTKKNKNKELQEDSADGIQKKSKTKKKNKEYNNEFQTET
ncbi:G patch domain-containing protein 4 [Teleopsis dalmanni]|uniref:G patch domain-containing protein 4 n=1 Tax=Teleopsis dalmanni TaxID=139649 RepID=UPI0018CF0698|nr:G patch domain-containing protein 4 [Teleopsis dalmanni]